MKAGERFRADFEKEYTLDDAGARALLDAACAALNRIEVMERRVNRDGAALAGSRGQLAAHPLLASIRAERDSFVRILNALGVGDKPSAATQAARDLNRKRWAS